MSTNNGGAAFPQLDVISGERDGHGDLIEPFTSISGGMSLRDWFAGQAVVAMAARFTTDNSAGLADLAERTYQVADAMLKAREADNG